MEVREGYILSEIGLIPIDWSTPKLIELGHFSKGQGISKSEANSGTIPSIRYGELYTRFNNYIDQYYSFVSSEVAKTAKRLRSGDILFAGSGETKEEIGKCAAFIDKIEAYAGGDIIIFSPKDIDSLFLGYLLNSSTIVRQKASKGQGDAIVHISTKTLKETKIPLPPTKSEQTAIATALSDADALIAGLEKLIAKKRNIKQGAMQELLKPKEGWEVKTVNDLAICLDSFRIPLNDAQRSSMKGDYPYCGANGVLDFINEYLIDDDIILIAEDGGYFDEYLIRPIAYKMTGKCWVNNHAHILKAKENIHQDFIYYSLVHKNILRFLANGTRAKLNKSEMYKIEIDTPKDYSDQVEIATILSDMDSEITALETKLEKYKMIKQGMMQTLLTGKIRLI